MPSGAGAAIEGVRRRSPRSCRTAGRSRRPRAARNTCGAPRLLRSRLFPETVLPRVRRRSGPAAGASSAHLGQGPQLRPRILPGVEFEREGVSAPVARAGGRGLGVVRGAPRLAEVAGVRVRRVPAPLLCTACCPARSPHPVPNPVTPTPPGPTHGGEAGGPGNVPRGGSRPPLPTGFFRPSSSLQTFPHRARIYVEPFSTADGLGQLHSPKEQGNRKGPRTSKCPPHSAAVGAAMSKRSSAKRIRLQRTTKKFS